MTELHDSTSTSSGASGAGDGTDQDPAGGARQTAPDQAPVREPPGGDWAAIIRHVKAHVWASLRGEDAANREDVAHDVIKRLRAFSSSIRGTDLKTWKAFVSTTTTRVCADYFREKRRKRSLDVPLDSTRDEGDDDDQQSLAPIQFLIASDSAEDFAILREELLEVLKAIRDAIAFTQSKGKPSARQSQSAAGGAAPTVPAAPTRLGAKTAGPKPRNAKLVRRDLAIVVKKYEGLGNEEIAEALGVTEGVVRNALNRLRKILVRDHPEWDEGRKRQGPKPGTKRAQGADGSGGSKRSTSAKGGTGDTGAKGSKGSKLAKRAQGGQEDTSAGPAPTAQHSQH